MSFRHWTENKLFYQARVLFRHRIDIDTHVDCNDDDDDNNHDSYDERKIKEQREKGQLNKQRARATYIQT